MPDSEFICVECGESCATPPESRLCPACGQRLVRRGAMLRTGIGRDDLDDEPAGRLPPEVEAASRDAQSKFDQYIIVSELGQGGAASVHRAWDIEQRRFVALKVLKTAFREQSARAVREAHAVTQLSHPNIIKVHKAGSFSGWRFIAMELVTGRTLDEAVGPATTPLRVRLELFRTVCDAIQHAHARGVVHRDLKPQNILVDDEGHPYVVDFGIARPTEAGWTVTLADQAIGTPSFMAPEQVHGGEPSAQPAVDVYALGAVLYYMLCGRPPFDAGAPYETMERVVRDMPVPPRALDPKIPIDLEVICLKCLEKSPADRFASVKELLADIDRWLAGEPVASLRISGATRLWRRLARHRIAVAASLLAGMLAVAGISWVVATRRAETARAKSLNEALKLLETCRIAIDKGFRDLYNPKATPEDIRRQADEGRKLAEQAVALAPELAPAQLLLGRAWELRGDNDKAEACARRAVELAADFAPARMALGRAMLTRAILSSMWGEDEKMKAGLGLEASELVQKASREMEAAASKERGLEDPLQREIAAAYLAYTRNEPDSLRLAVGNALMRFEGMQGTEELYWLAGHTYLELPQRIDAYSRAILIRPHYMLAVLFRSIARAQAGDNAGAVADIDEAFRLGADFPELYHNRGSAKANLGDVDGAIADLDEAIRRKPGFAHAHLTRAMARMTKGDADGCLADTESAVKARPGYASAWFCRGLAKSNKGDKDGAIADYGQAIVLNPRYAEAYCNRANVWWDRGDAVHAHADYAKALEVAPPDWPHRARVEECLKDAERRLPEH